MSLTTFAVDALPLAPLKKVYGTKSNAATIKRALAVALILSRYADSDGAIHIVNSAGAEIVIPQRP